MQAAEKGIGTFLRQYRELVIPVYQRNYDWKKENCAQLFSDIERIAENNHEMHFIGTICTQAQNFATSVIIDGQQRITSIMLLLKAIAHNTEEEKLKSYIESSFLFGSNWNTEAKMKLKPIKKDEGIFSKLISSNKFNALSTASSIS